MLRSHTVSDGDLAALASGHGGPDVIRALWRGQDDKRVLLMGEVVREIGARSDGTPRAVAMLRRAAETAPAAVRSVLTEPMVSAWCASSLRATAAGRPVDDRRLDEIALVAAHRAGLAWDLSIGAGQRGIHLPGLGRIDIGGGPTRVATERGRLLVDGSPVTPSDDRWLTRRRLPADGPPPTAPLVEDLDPHRHLYHVRGTERLSPREADAWLSSFRGGWAVLSRHCPRRAHSIAAGLHSIVPLERPDPRSSRSATSDEAVGVVATDLPASDVDFAVTLVHEFQHSKLQAVHDVAPLFTASEEEHFAPWRTDPRPLGGFLQGTYAFLGVADAWRSLHETPGAFPRAAEEFAQTRAYLTDAAARLARSAALTDAGRLFVARMTASIAALGEVRVPGSAEAAARRGLEEIRAAWELHNRRQAGSPL
jgi:HEXXH motif-containing protein